MRATCIEPAVQPLGRRRPHNQAMPLGHRAHPVRVRPEDCHDWPLWNAAGTRALEAEAKSKLPAGALMQRAGHSVARWARALAPHALRAWVAAGPGGNGGDGLYAAAYLRKAGLEVQVTLVADAGSLAAEPAAALEQAREAGCVIGPALPDSAAELAIDALLGLGAHRAPAGTMLAAMQAFNGMPGCRLAVDLPSGLHADTGTRLGAVAASAHATLSLLTLKPALFTGAGRDHAGEAWFDDLGCETRSASDPVARLATAQDVAAVLRPRLHERHKGSFGDVLVVGGATGMLGAVRLAAQGAAAAGPGRVFVSPLDPAHALADAQHPEWLWTACAWLPGRHRVEETTVVCGCGGALAVAHTLPPLLARSPRLVLDADALNALAHDPQLRRQLQARRARGQATVLTPHPLEAARLLGCETAQVQSDRIGAARALTGELQATVLLKGSGSVIAGADRLPTVNPTGSGSLATGGTGDVLAGWLGGLWAGHGTNSACNADETGWRCAIAAAWLHGRAGERPGGSPVRPGELARALAIDAEAWRAQPRQRSFSVARASWPAGASPQP